MGGCIEATEKTLSYSHTSCADALQMLADEFKTEWEIRGKAIYLRRVEYNKANPLRLRYGRDCGLKPGVSRDNFGAKKPCEILLVQGGRKNIDASTYGSVELLLPKSQTIAFDGTKFADEAGFNAATARSYKTDATGTEITRADRPLLTFVEDSIDLSQIYPKRVGTVSSVEMIAGKDGHVNYDIIDSSIPESLDYNKALIKGQTMKVIFQSGNLTGAGAPAGEYGRVPGQTSQGPAGPPAARSTSRRWVTPMPYSVARCPMLMCVTMPHGRAPRGRCSGRPCG